MVYRMLVEESIDIERLDKYIQERMLYNASKLDPNFKKY